MDTATVKNSIGLPREEKKEGAKIIWMISCVDIAMQQQPLEDGKVNGRVIQCH